MAITRSWSNIFDDKFSTSKPGDMKNPSNFAKEYLCDVGATLTKGFVHDAGTCTSAATGIPFDFNTDGIMAMKMMLAATVTAPTPTIKHDTPQTEEDVW